MKKLIPFALALTTALVLTACGGGSDDSAAAGSGSGTGTNTGTGSGTGTSTGGTATNPVHADYTNYYRLQDLTAAGTTATFTDNGVGVAGTVSVRGQSVSMTPQSDGGIAYGAPYTSGVAVGSNPQASNLPALAMLCQAAASGDGTNGRKSSDVMVSTQATRITTAAVLANQSFTVFREDCAVAAGSSLRFDASGNATVVDGSGSTAITAADVNRALSGAAPIGEGSDGFVALYAYSYRKGDGSTVYAIVEHGGTSTTGLARGYVSLWAQQ